MAAGIYTEINLICVFILFVFMYKLQTCPFPKKSQSLFIFNLICQMIFFICDCIWSLIDSGAIVAGINVNYLVNIVYFSISGLAGYSWLLYCGSLQDSKIYKNKTLLGLLLIPFMILTIMTINSPFKKWIFYLDENGKYFRGDFYIVQVIIVSGYIFLASIISWTNAFKKENSAKRLLYIILGNYAIFSMLAIALQLFLPGYPFVAIGTTIPLLIAFLKMDSLQSMTDPSTGLHNRNWLFAYFEDIKRHYNEGNLSLTTRHFFMTIKIYDYNEIREKYGTQETEKLISELSDIITGLTLQLKRTSTVSTLRYAKDEFAIFISTEDSLLPAEFEERVNNSLSASNQDTLKIQYSIATGLTEYSIENEHITDQLEKAEYLMEMNHKKTIA